MSISAARKEKRVWDGDKSVFVVLVGKSVVLPCVNRRQLWTGQSEGRGPAAGGPLGLAAPGITRHRAGPPHRYVRL